MATGPTQSSSSSCSRRTQSSRPRCDTTRSCHSDSSVAAARGKDVGGRDRQRQALSSRRRRCNREDGRRVASSGEADEAGRATQRRQHGALKCAQRRVGRSCAPVEELQFRVDSEHETRRNLQRSELVRHRGGRRRSSEKAPASPSGSPSSQACAAKSIAGPFTATTTSRGRRPAIDASAEGRAPARGRCSSLGAGLRRPLAGHYAESRGGVGATEYLSPLVRSSPRTRCSARCVHHAARSVRTLSERTFTLREARGPRGPARRRRRLTRPRSDEIPKRSTSRSTSSACVVPVGEHLPEEGAALVRAQIGRRSHVDGDELVVDLAPDERLGSQSQLGHQ